jgi:hypothetical protein
VDLYPHALNFWELRYQATDFTVDGLLPHKRTVLLKKKIPQDRFYFENKNGGCPVFFACM